MGQCVSSSTTGVAAGNNQGEPDPHCQAPGCQKARDQGSKSRYCVQHAVCRRQGCTRPRYRKGPYCQEHLHTCRVSRCPNDQARFLDAWFTNHLCFEHQPDDVRYAYFYGLVPEAGAASGAATNDHQQHTRRRRRSRQKPSPIPAPTDVAPAPDPREPSSEDSSSESESDEASVAGRRLSVVGEETDGDDILLPSIKKPRDLPDTTPGTPTARRSQKTVHFAESLPRTSSPERNPIVAADAWTVDPVSTSSAHRLRSSRHRRSVESRPGTRPSPKASSSSVEPVARSREKRSSTGSTPKPTEVKRVTRRRSSH